MERLSGLASLCGHCFLSMDELTLSLLFGVLVCRFCCRDCGGDNGVTMRITKRNTKGRGGLSREL